MINSYDIDGVIYMGGKYTGLRPGPWDIIVTGRSLEDEGDMTDLWLKSRGMFNRVYMNPVRFHEKTRFGSGRHKAETLNMLWDRGIQVGLHFEDDPIQAEVIERECPRVKVVCVVHNLVEKENVWHGNPDDKPSAGADT